MSLGGMIERAFYGTQTFDLGQLGQLIHGVHLGGDSRVIEPYSENWIVYACVRARCNAIVSAPLQLWTSREDDADLVPETHPLALVLAHPNPWMSGRKFRWITNAYRDLDGACLWVLRKKKSGRMVDCPPGAIPDEIWPVRGSKVAVEIDETTMLAREYRVTLGTGSDLTVPAHSAVPFYDFNPTSWRDGFGGADAVAKQISIDHNLDRYDAAMAKRAGLPSVVFEATDELTATQIKQSQTDIEQRLNGVDNTNKPVVLNKGLKPIPLGFSPKDMLHPEQRKWNRDAIMAAFGVTKPFLGITDDVNRANAREAVAVFWDSTGVPLLDDYADTMQEMFLRKLTGPEREWAVSFDLSRINALQEDTTAVLARVKTVVDFGVRLSLAAKMVGWDVDEALIEEADAEAAATKQAAADAQAAALAAVAEEPKPDEPEPVKSAAPTHTRARTEDEAEAARLAIEAATAALRTKLSKRVAASHTSYVLAYRRRLDEWAEQHRAAAPQVTRATDEEVFEMLRSIVPDVAEFAGPLGKDARKILDQMFSTSAAKLAAEIGLDVAKSPALAETAVLLSKRVALVEGTLTTLSAEVTDALARALVSADGFSNATLTEAVRDALEDMRGAVTEKKDRLAERAQAIARTETTAVQGAARTAEMRANGIKRHEWVSERTATTRETHAAMHGKVVEIGRSFRDDVTLRWPGDALAPAGEVVNCSCSVLPVIDEDLNV